MGLVRTRRLEYKTKINTTLLPYYHTIIHTIIHFKLPAQVKNQPWGWGWNAQTGVYEDLMVSGVIDPATVTVQACDYTLLYYVYYSILLYTVLHYTKLYDIIRTGTRT